MSNHLARTFPLLGSRLEYMSLADLPTPVTTELLVSGSRHREITIKHDDVSGVEYGGNKLRKLEYILQQAKNKGAQRIATFGTVGSNHALATALYARRAGFECTCFLSHQALRPGLGNTLRFHLQNGTEIVHYSGSHRERVSTMRKYLRGGNVWVVPLGGSSWLGTVGNVNAGLELAAQIEAGELPCPKRVYIAFGTMGSAAGLAMGIALSGLDIETHAIRVSRKIYANDTGLRRLMRKTAAMMHAIDPAIPHDLEQRASIVCRDEFFGTGYGRTNDATERAIALARDELGISLESTYTGKAMAGLLHDVGEGCNAPLLFWNTYNSRRLAIDDTLQPDFNSLPKEFARYFD